MKIKGHNMKKQLKRILLTGVAATGMQLFVHPTALAELMSPSQAEHFIKEPSDSNEQLARLFKYHQEYSMFQFPEWATYEGDHRYDDRLTDFSEKAVHNRFQDLHRLMSLLDKIAYAGLNVENKLNYSLFKAMLSDSLAEEPFQFHLTPLSQQNGLHIDFPQIIESQPLQTVADYQKYFARLRGFEQQVTDEITNMRQGMAKKTLLPRFIIEQVLEQIGQIKAMKPEQSPFYSPLLQTNSQLTVSDKERLSVSLKDLIQHTITPAYERLYSFVKDTYLPQCPEQAGIWTWPDGQKRYAHLIKSHTGTDMTADQIHELGLKEVTRIRAEMEQIKIQLGFRGSLDEFNQYLKTDPRFYFTKKADLMAGFQQTLDKMNQKLPQLFGTLPQAPCELKEMEEYRAKSAPQAYYYSAPEDRSRPAYFYVNAYDLPSRPKYTMTALTLHEAVPGHHLQIAIAQERSNLPFFRKHYGLTAFTEGWGLYAESLGYETGMYTDLYQHYGALAFESWRASRLVVDTGIHHKHWSRQQAVDFMRKNTSNSELDIRSEVDRYIAWPGQALAYKMGELRFKQLRKKAEKALGTRFDIRAFHDSVLTNGVLPFDVLEKELNID
jgi:uncharacterized protein (DUF885 family)